MSPGLSSSSFSSLSLNSPTCAVFGLRKSSARFNRVVMNQLSRFRGKLQAKCMNTQHGYPSLISHFTSSPSWVLSDQTDWYAWLLTDIWMKHELWTGGDSSSFDWASDELQGSAVTGAKSTTRWEGTVCVLCWDIGAPISHCLSLRLLWNGGSMLQKPETLEQSVCACLLVIVIYY